MNLNSFSIRRRLTALLLGSVGILVVAANLALAIFIDQRLQAEYDSSLLTKARALVTLTEQDVEGVELEFADEFMPEFEAEINPEYFQLWFENDSVLERSRSLGYREDGSALSRPDSLRYDDLPKLATLSDTPRFRNVTLPDGRSGRLVQIDFVPQIDEDDRALLSGQVQRYVTVVVAREREQLDALLNWFTAGLFIISAVLLILIIIVVRFAVNSGLRPLHDIHEQVRTLDVNSLHARLTTSQPTVELDAVIDQFNKLLERLESAFARERQFTSDVAHELRTPLAELRNLSEVALRWPEDQTLAQSFFREVLGATLQMERIVINLLALARHDKGLEVIEMNQFDLIELIAQAWRRILPEAQDKKLVLKRQGPQTLEVCTGRDQVELILCNLFTNAVAYSPKGSKIVCVVETNSPAVTLSVANRAEHLDKEDLAFIFDRLWRKDAARSGGYHAGLGLALVKAYAEQIQLAVQVALEPEQIFRITLSGAMQAAKPATV